MPIPRKFQKLVEVDSEAVDQPDYVWLAYSACVMSPEACGWTGWVLEAAYQNTQQRHPTGTGDKLLSTADEQQCPRCGRSLFRTGVAARLERSENQAPPQSLSGRHYEVSPIEYSD
jgi:hypothetical protein